MSKPFFMKFHQPGEYGVDIWINMNKVCHIIASGTYSMITFEAVIEGCPALMVDETPEQIATRQEWNYK